MAREQVIAVIQNGWVLAGEVEDESDSGEYPTIISAWCVARWGTKQGIGELRNGPTKDTVRHWIGRTKLDTKPLFTIRGVEGWQK